MCVSVDQSTLCPQKKTGFKLLLPYKTAKSGFWLGIDTQLWLS